MTEREAYLSLRRELKRMRLVLTRMGEATAVIRAHGLKGPDMHVSDIWPHVADLEEACERVDPMYLSDEE